ncbi:MAG: hypothetical protein ACREBJ_04660, partial [Nitrosotalea sp.]
MLESVFTRKSLNYYRLFQYLTHKIDKDQLISHLSENRDLKIIDNFKVIPWFNRLNKGPLSRTLALIYGGSVGLRIFLYYLQCHILLKFSDTFDSVLAVILFLMEYVGIAAFTAGHTTFHSHLAVFFGVFFGQVLFSILVLAILALFYDGHD